MEFDFLMDQKQLNIFAQTQDIELYKNFRQENGDDLEEDAQIFIDKIKEDGFAVAVSGGFNSAGKGGFSHGLRNILLQNEELNEYIEEENIDFGLFTLPISLCDDAVMLRNVPKRFAVPSGLTPSQYTKEQIDRISGYQWYLFEKYVAPRKGKAKTATAAIIECGVPLVYPITKSLPLQTEGVINGGMDTFYNLALDPKYRNDTMFYLLDRHDPRVLNAGKDFRSKIFTDEVRIEDTFDNPEKLVITAKNNQKVEVANLDLKYQRQIKEFLRKTMGSPGVIDKFDNISQRFKQELADKGLINDDSNISYLRFIGDRLGLLDCDNFRILNNYYLSGPKTYNLDYFFDSLVARVHPEVLAPVNLEELRDISKKNLKRAA